VVLQLRIDKKHLKIGGAQLVEKAIICSRKEENV